MNSPPTSLAQLRNVSNFAAAMDDAMHRQMHLPGLVAFHGPSGFGKTMSAVYAANVHRAHYVETRSTWTKRALCRGILGELGVDPAERVYDMVAQIAESLAGSQRPLILDEADYILQGGMIEIVRDIHESSGAVIALIGEERLPAKLRQVERVHNRVLQFVAAVPADLQDARQLAALYCPRHRLGDDLLGQVITAADGGARRICVNLEAIRQEAAKRPAELLDCEWWGALPLVTGRVEPRQQFAAAPARKLAVVR